MASQRLALTLAVAVACIAGTALAADFPVSWSTDPTPTSITAVCGDTITLTWTGNHDVAKASTGNCPLTGAQAATSLADASIGGTHQYTVKSTDTTFWLICTVSNHCTTGQNIKVTATCPPATNGTAAGNTTTNGTTNATVVYDTVIPKAAGGNTYSTSWRVRKIADLKLTCDDDVRFYWNSTGTLFKHALMVKPYEALANMNDSCTDIEANNSTKQLLVPQQTIGNHTWQPKENGDYYFICTVGQHCLNGQRVRATVTGCAKTSTIYKPGGVSAASNVSGTPPAPPKKSAAHAYMPVASWLMALVALAAFWAS